MDSSNLLKEAIADAKAVRATALANAKVALEEAFAPRFHAMFADKLKEEAQQGDVTTTPTIPEGKEEEEESASGQEIDELIKELEAEVGGEEESPMPPTGDAGAGDSMPPTDMPPTDTAAPAVGAPIPAGVPVIIQPVDQAGTAGAGAGAPPMPPTPPAGEPPVPSAAGGAEEEEEVNLDELLESLKEEAEGEEKEEIDENAPVGTSAIGGKVGGSDNKKPSADASATSHLENAGKDRVGMPTAKVTSQEPTEASRPNAGPVTKDKMDTPKLAKESVETGVPGGKVTAKEPTEAARPNSDGEFENTPSMKAENIQLKKQLSEAYETVKYIKGQLNEINLLNAKLLYTNKLLKEFSMSNEQKMRVVEMFDLSKNVREVKLTYATIAESLNFSGDMKKKAPANASVQSITEGIASKPVGSTKPSKEIISEGRFAARMKVLAGIPANKK